MAMENLYPPIIATYMPAFVKDGVQPICRVYFSFSSYNDPEEINKDAVQVTVTDQNTSISALNPSSYPSGIKICKLKIDEEKLSDDKYYIELSPLDLKDGFEINTYYKVQIRFTAAGVSLPAENTGIDSWLTGNLKSFSEWSTVCLIRGISTPKMTIVGFRDGSESTLWNSTMVDIVGRLTFADESEDDTLKSYRIKVYNQFENLLTDSGIIYSESLYSNINEMNYTFEYNFQDAESYILEVEWTTRNLYTQIDRHPFNILEETSGTLDARVAAEVDDENGRIGVHIKGKDMHQTFAGSFTIRRTSSDTNFTIWEDIKTLTMKEESALDLTWWDMTVENGVWYKYCVQRRDSLGARGIAVVMKNPVMTVSEHTFLVADDRQLKLKLNPQVSSWKYNVMESKIDTIGGRYPFIKRNGETYYRSFPISGMISHFMDKSDYSIDPSTFGNNLFTSREELFAESLDRYNEYNQENNIDEYSDYLYEREFREKVIEFLYKNNVKLFRSTQEGNVLVKLMDINLTPVEGLGRYLYSFSATAYEIDKCTISNYYKYNIQELLGDYERQIISYLSYLGQINTPIEANQEVLDLISKEYQKYSKEGYSLVVKKLDYLQLHFDSKPYLITESGTGPVPVDSIGQSRMVLLNQTKDEILENAILGYIVEINDKSIIVNPEGVYELMGEGVEITSVKFPVKTECTINYNIRATQEEKLTDLIKIRTYYNKVGQIWGGFKYKKSVYEDIWNKYYLSYTDYIQTLLAVNRVVIEADQGTIVYIKESDEDEAEPHLIGDTCLLEIDVADSSIEDIYFAGMQLKEVNDFEKERSLIPNHKYVIVEEEIPSFDKIPVTLIKNGLYTIEGDKYIYDGLYFYPAIIENDIVTIKKPIDAIINYDCYVMKGEYNL